MDVTEDNNIYTINTVNMNTNKDSTTDIRKDTNKDATTNNNTDNNRDNHMDDIMDVSSPKSSVRYSTTFLYLTAFGVTLDACALGYNLSSVSGAMLYVQPYFQLDDRWQVRHQIERSICLCYVYLGLSVCLYVCLCRSVCVEMHYECIWYISSMSYSRDIPFW